MTTQHPLEPHDHASQTRGALVLMAVGTEIEIAGMVRTQVASVKEILNHWQWLQRTTT